MFSCCFVVFLHVLAPPPTPLQVTAKLRVMPRCWLVLLRCWVRVDGSLVRLRESRLFCRWGGSGWVRVAEGGEWGVWSAWAQDGRIERCERWRGGLTRALEGMGRNVLYPPWPRVTSPRFTPPHLTSPLPSASSPPACTVHWAPRRATDTTCAQRRWMCCRCVCAGAGVHVLWRGRGFRGAGP